MRSLRCTALIILAVLVSGLLAPPAQAQGVVGDLLGGNLIKPKVGQWVWYTLTDKLGKESFAVRQAVVGKEDVGNETGYWVEFEVVPEIGFKMLYKVLLTGPASDPRNIHRIIQKDGTNPPREVPVDREALEEDAPSKPKRESLGMETIRTPAGPVRAEHLKVVEGGHTIDLYVNEDIKPTGIVRMSTPDGEMVLRSKGFGGKYGESALDEASGSEPPPAPRVETRGETGSETEHGPAVEPEGE